MVDYLWTCSCCGRQHKELPTCWSFGPPASFWSVPEAERADRADLQDDLCRVDDHFFIRGHIEIPIIGMPDFLVFSVWASISEASLDRIAETWDDADRDKHGPFFAWLNSEVVPYPGSLNLATELHNRPPGMVPLVQLEPTEHPLSKAQRDGVTMERVVEIAERLMPRH